MDNSILKSLKTLKKSRLGNDYWEYTYPEWSPAQMAFLESKETKLLIEASRRSGKSVAGAERMLKKVNTPHFVNGKPVYGGYVYIAPTKNAAKNIIWDELKEMCRKRGQAFQSHEVDLTIKFPRGGFIQLEGAGLADSADKARGRKRVGVMIDEAAFIGPLRELVGIWSKTLYDYGGELVLSSSPGKSKTGYFYNCSHGEDKEHWAQFYLNGEENPLFKNGRYQQLIAEDLATLYGGNPNHPEYRRECLGEWIEESNLQLIKYDEKRNLYTDLHSKNNDVYSYVIGLDLGYLDSTAISVAAVAKYEPEAIFVDEFVQSEMRIMDIIAKVEEYSQKWDADVVVVDSGGMGQHTYQELINREGLPAVDRAQKYGKKLNIETLNNELYAGRVKVLPSCKLTIDAWKKVLKNDKGTEDESCDYGSQGILDILDASLYAAMELIPSVHDQIKPQESVEERMKRKKFEKLDKANRSLERYGMKGFF